MKSINPISRFSAFFYLLLPIVIVPVMVAMFFVWQEKTKILPQSEELNHITLQIEQIKKLTAIRLASLHSTDTLTNPFSIKEDEIYQSANELKRIAKNFLEPDSLNAIAQTANSLENTARTLVGIKQNLAQIDPKQKDEIEKITQSLLDYQKELNTTALLLNEKTNPLLNAIDQHKQSIQTQIAYSHFVITVLLSASSLLFLIILMILIFQFRSKLLVPFQNINNLLLQWKANKLNTEQLVVQNSPIPLLSELLQNMLIKQNATIETATAILEDKNFPLSTEQIDTQIYELFKDIQKKITQLKTTNQQIQSEYQRIKNENEQTIEEQRKQIIKINHRLEGINPALAIAESDLQGRITFANQTLAQLSEYSIQELLNQPFKIFNSGYHDAEFFQNLWQTISKGNTWKGNILNKTKSGQNKWMAISITPILDALGKVSKFVFTAFDINHLVQQDKEVKEALSKTLDEHQNLLKNYQKILQERDELKAAYDKQKNLEYRLIQQQAALQELTRNPNILEGKISEAIVTITESLCYTLDHDRAALWLFNEDQSILQVIDFFDRQQLAHFNHPYIQQKFASNFFSSILNNQPIIVDDVLNNPLTSEMADYYFIPHHVTSVMASPIRLGGSVVGCITVEHTNRPTQWAPDQIAFLNSVADLVSMTLEQGNRKVMEEELRTSLEESQALEEELRQNAEEIEATNEELRRAQIELKGQIEALNAAAIVSETNTNGLITYVNNEFIQMYGFRKEEIFGKTHKIIKSEEHSKEFFQEMWSTILKGKVWKGEIKNKSKEGWYYWINLTITPVIGSDGKPYKFIAVGFNISSQKLQEEQLKTALEVALQQEEMLRENTEELLAANEEMRRTQVELIGQISALNHSSMVFETDMDANITYVNSELLHVLGFSKEELLGKPYTFLKSPYQNDKVLQEQWKTILNGKIWKGEVELKAKNNDSVWVWMTNTPVLDSDNEPIKSINVLFDITPQKQQEFRLRTQQSALLEITSHPAVKEAKTDEAFAVIAQIGLATLSVDRVSIWIYEDNDTKIRCITTAHSDGTTHKYQKGTVLQRDFYPNYFTIIEKERVIAANEAISDPRTKELAIPLFVPNNIQSVLDISIRQSVKTVGILSFEVRNKQRKWSLDEQNFATSLADAISLVLEQHERLKIDQIKEAYEQLELINQEVRRQKEELEESNTNMKESIKYAKRIQQNILPSKELMNSIFTHWFVTFKPRDIVGGDFYWVSKIEHQAVLVVADGTGHGVPGAFLTMIGNILLNQIVNEKKITRPADILHDLHIGVRQTLRQDAEDSTSRDGMDVALVTINMETLECQYAGANLPCNYIHDYEVIEIKADKQSIGGEQMEEERIFKNHTFQLKKGDGIYLYTDGFVDQLGGPDGKRFSTRRFKDLIFRTQSDSMATQRANLNMEWKDWKGDLEQLDDVTVVGIRL